MDYVVRLEQLGSHPLAVVRRRATLHELSKVVPDACGTVWDALRSRRATGAGRHVAVYLDDQINLEVGVELDGPVRRGRRGRRLGDPIRHHRHDDPLRSLRTTPRGPCGRSALVRGKRVYVGRPVLGDLWSLERGMERRPIKNFHPDPPSARHRREFGPLISRGGGYRHDRTSLGRVVPPSFGVGRREAALPVLGKKA